MNWWENRVQIVDKALQQYLLLLEGPQGAGGWCPIVQFSEPSGKAKEQTLRSLRSPHPASPGGTGHYKGLWRLQLLGSSCWKRVTNQYPTSIRAPPLQPWLFSHHCSHYICLFTCVQLKIIIIIIRVASVHWMEHNFVHCPYGKALWSNAAFVTLWPALRGSNPSLQHLLWWYHLPCSSMYFRFLYRSFLPEISGYYRNHWDSKIHCQKQSYLWTGLHFPSTHCWHRIKCLLNLPQLFLLFPNYLSTVIIF